MATATPLASPLLNHKEAAAFLRISQTTLTKFTLAGTVPSIFIGAQRRYHREELDRIAREGLS